MTIAMPPRSQELSPADSSLPVETAPRELVRLPAVGDNLRRLRRRKGYSLERLAQASGVSRAMLSQIERARSAPTINLLWRIASGLAVPFSSLLGALLDIEEDVSAAVLRVSNAPSLRSADGGFVSRPLFPLSASQRRTEFYELRLQGLSRQQSEPHPPGTTENLVVAAGKVRVQVGREHHELAAGDAIYFGADISHGYENLGESTAVLYLVMTYGRLLGEPG